MSRREDKGRLPPFVPLILSTINTPAWKALSHGARSLYVALRRRYSRQFRNNGHIYLSQRAAAEEIGSHHNEIARWFRELQFYGFIVMTKGGSLGVEGKGKAPHWRLTELGYMNELPTRDFECYTGAKFVDRKTKPRAPFPAHSVREMAHTQVREMAHTNRRMRDGNGAHTATADIAEIQHISSLTTPPAVQLRQIRSLPSCRVGEAKTQAKRPAAVGMSKGTGKNSEPLRDGKESSASVSRKALRQKRAVDIVS
jgi:hypothetical protein